MRSRESFDAIAIAFDESLTCPLSTDYRKSEGPS